MTDRYEVIPMKRGLHDPEGWWTVTCNGEPVRHYRPTNGIWPNGTQLIRATGPALSPKWRMSGSDEQADDTRSPDPRHKLIPPVAGVEPDGEDGEDRAEGLGQGHRNAIAPATDLTRSLTALPSLPDFTTQPPAVLPVMIPTWPLPLPRDQITTTPMAGP